MGSPFDGCRERITRANAHSNTFGEIWAAFLAEDPYEFSLDLNSDGTGSLRVRPRRPVPVLLGVELGEMLYQLRAALDGAVYAAAVHETGSDPPPDEESLEFPICDSEAAFDKAGWKIGPLSDECKAVIWRVQPCNTSGLAEETARQLNGILGTLNDWARKDRHRKLHLAGSWHSSANPQFRLPPGATVSFEIKGPLMLEHQDEVVRFVVHGFEPGMEIEIDPDSTIEVAVDESPVPRDRTDTLSERVLLMQAAVESILRMFEVQLGLREQPGTIILDSSPIVPPHLTPRPPSELPPNH